ncbi:MAG: hypothetical protein JWR50_3211 [Mucilaginibacter sp.]|nr:hypothetical protein [Mucilaginibacter sp.]
MKGYKLITSDNSVVRFKFYTDEALVISARLNLTFELL